MSREKNVQVAREIYLELEAVYDKEYALFKPLWDKFRIELDAYHEVPWQRRDVENMPKQPEQPRFEPVFPIMVKLGVSRRTALEYIDVIKFLESSKAS